MSHGTIEAPEPGRTPRTIPPARSGAERRRNLLDAESLSLCQLQETIAAMKPAGAELVSEPDRTSYLALLDVAARALQSAVHCLNTERILLR